ncbi:MAG: 6-bladed beta-propeller [Tannerellaceae bacterium]|nr:6-bladed beta-propeller [Tannerellaceae bacterium]
MTTKHWILFLFSLWFCNSCQQKKMSSDLKFIELNVEKKYPVKELFLDDLAEIEYILPSLHDDFLYRGGPRLITEDYLIAYEMEKGEILVFDRQGEPLHRINRSGEGPEEFFYVFDILYDPIVDELYVSTLEKIQVYSIKGEYKRSIPVKSNFISRIQLFDEHNFLCHDNYGYYPNPFFLVSRESGQIAEDIDIRYETKLEMYIQRQDGEMIYTNTGPQTNIVRVKEGFILTDYSVDTVYLYTPEKQLTPVLMRAPSITTQNPYIYLNSYLESPSYLFMNTVSNEFDWNTGRGFPQTNLMLDRKDGKVYEQKIWLKEYKGKELSLSPGMQSRVSGSMSGLLVFSPEELQEALEEGKLSGQLKDIVSRMDEESNMLVLLFRFK